MAESIGNRQPDYLCYGSTSAIFPGSKNVRLGEI